jgi:hypothetical protein
VQISAGVIGKFSERRFKMPSPRPMDRRDFLKLAGPAAAPERCDASGECD